MQLSHFITAYPSPSPCPQVHSIRLRLYSCPARWERFAGCDIVRPGSGHREELVQSRSRKPERRPWGSSRETRSLGTIVRETPQDMCPVRKGKEFCSFLCISSPLIQWPPCKAPGRFILLFIQCIPSASQPGSASDFREEVQRADLPKITTCKK